MDTDILFTGGAMLDADRYSIIAIIKQTEQFNIIIQRYTGAGQPHYCIQYAGSGHYFSDARKLQKHYQSCYKRPLKQDKKRALKWDDGEMQKLLNE